MTIVDRRTAKPWLPAVHVIVKSADKLVEIQVRTALQHIWAEQSEKLSDIVDPAIKHGGGDLNIQQRHKESSDWIAEVESIELELAGEQESLSSLLSQGSLTEEQQKKLTATQNYQKRVSAVRQGISKRLRDSIDSLPRQ